MITKPKIYTEKYVKKQVSSILDTVISNKDILYIGELFEELPFPRQCYSEWANDFKEIRKISDTIKRIDSILESRVNVAGLKGKANPTMVIFNLKNNYNWKDKVEQELSNPDGNLKTITIIKTNGSKDNTST